MNNLLAKTVGGYLFLLLVLAAALFLSAGSLRFWQGWVFLAVFFGCTLLITLYLFRYDQKLLASRVQAGPAAETQVRQQIIQGVASLCFIGLFVVAGLDFRYEWSAVPAGLSWLANGCVALSLFVVFLVFRANSYTSTIIEVAQEQRVIDQGPYSLVRHPMYTGASLMLLVLPLALGSYVALPLALLLILVIGVRAIEEEKFLVDNLRGYAAYRQKVRYRLVPFVW